MEIARYYVDAQRSFVELTASLDADGWATPVPCAPDWTVRDVLSHVAGVTDDIANGRVDGAGTDPWTAAQVERWRDTEPTELIAQWNDQIAGVAEAIEAFGERRPVLDCHIHEQDVRHALGHPGNRDSELLDALVEAFAAASLRRPVTVSFDDGSSIDIAGSTDREAISLGGVSRFELVRSRLGRRSPDQVRGYDWSQPIDDELLDGWFAFGPTELPIVE